MLVIAASMIGGFIFAALLTDGNVDDDDGPGGGLMQPAFFPTPFPIQLPSLYYFGKHTPLFFFFLQFLLLPLSLPLT